MITLSQRLRQIPITSITKGSKSYCWFVWPKYTLGNVYPSHPTGIRRIGSVICVKHQHIESHDNPSINSTMVEEPVRRAKCGMKILDRKYRNRSTVHIIVPRETTTTSAVYMVQYPTECCGRKIGSCRSFCIRHYETLGEIWRPAWSSPSLGDCGVTTE